MNLRLEFDSFQDFAARLWPCLSEEGMWVATEERGEVGELVDFDVALADGFRLFHGSGQVVGVGPGPGSTGGRGVAIRFWELDQPSRNLLRKVVSKHVGEGGAAFDLDAITDSAAAGDDSRLAAPFPEIEAGSDFDDAEPGLESFLRSRQPAAGEDTPSWGDAEGGREPVAQDPPPAADAALPPRERRSFSEMNTRFEEVLAETQLVTPLDADEDEAARRAVEAISFDSDPGWAPPPASARSEPPPPAVDFDEPFESEAIDMTGRGRKRGGWLPWALVGAVAVAAGLFVAGQFDSPIAGWLGGGEDVEVAPEEAPAEAPPDLAAIQEEDLAAGGEVIEVEAPAAEDSPPPAEEVVAPEVAVAEATPSAVPVEEPSAPAAREAAPSTVEPLRLVRVTFADEAGDTIVRLWLSGTPQADRLEALRLRDGAPRAVVKIAGIAGAVPRAAVPIGSPHVIQLRFGLHPAAGGSRLHVVADLASPDVEMVGPPAVDADGIELRFRGAS